MCEDVCPYAWLQEVQITEGQIHPMISLSSLCVLLTRRTAGLKLWANFRRELRSCWNPWSSIGEAWWTPEGQLVPGCLFPCCWRRHTLVLIKSRRSHNSSWTTYRDEDKINSILWADAQPRYIGRKIRFLSWISPLINIPQFFPVSWWPFLALSSLCMLCCTWSRSVLQCRYIALLCDTHAMQLQCTPALTKSRPPARATISWTPDEKSFLQRRLCWAAGGFRGSRFSAFIYLFFTCIFATTTISLRGALDCFDINMHAVRACVPVCDW